MQAFSTVDAEAFFQRHTNVAMLFSAGKDSAAMLELLRPFWERLTVVWCNPGRPYPETVEYMARIESQVPYFKMVLGRQVEYIERHGHPVDILPSEATPVGKLLCAEPGPHMVLYEQCCGHNLWMPALRWFIDNQITGVLRGQKHADRLRAPGPVDVTSPIEYWDPISTWTHRDVREFLGDRIPDSYKRGIPHSLDCMNCTAYTIEGQQRIRELEATNPTVYAEIKMVHLYLKEKLRLYASALEE